MAGRGGRALIGRFVPSHLDDPVGLAKRVLSSGAPGGRFAVLLAALGLLAAPADHLLERRERARYSRAEAPSRPILFVCGPPRSGTTLVGLSLMRSLDVAYLTNATSVFPLSPITAGDLFRAIPDGRHVPLESYYGRTAGFRAPNDGLHLWDRWLGTDRGLVRHHIEADRAQAMVEFFGAYEAWTGRPLVAKNNALDAHAALVASHLPTARFLCLTRDPLFLGQSLLLARRAIHGSDRREYGLHDPAGTLPHDLYRDIARQVAFHRELAHSQEAALGRDRFEVIDYEDFCAAPREHAERIGRGMGVAADAERLPARIEPSRQARISPVEFEALEAAIDERDPA